MITPVDERLAVELPLLYVSGGRESNTQASACEAKILTDYYTVTALL